MRTPVPYLALWLLLGLPVALVAQIPTECGIGADLRMAPVDYIASGEVAVVLGRFVITGSELEDGNRSGPFAVVLRYTGGDWVVRTILFASPG